MHEPIRTTRIKLGKAQRLVAEVRFNDVSTSDDVTSPPEWLGAWFDQKTGELVVTNWKGALDTIDSAADIVRDWADHTMDPDERSEHDATIRLRRRLLAAYSEDV